MPPPDQTPAVSRRTLGIAGTVIAIVAVAVVVAGLLARQSDAARLRARADDVAVPTVAVITPGRTAAAATLDLPGRIEANARAPIYARVSGYLKSWRADIGTPVKAGQLLAEIETPDLDQQLLQARADLATAQANATQAGTTAARWQSLLATDSVSKQEVEEKSSDYKSKQSVVNAAQANLDRFVTMKGFARITSPFDGVVTVRSTDVGALINAGGGGQELFVVSDTRKLRVYVSVPQNYVSLIKRGSKAKLAVPEHTGKSFAAVVESSAQSVNAASGAMLMQLAVDNAGAQLLPGGFATVSFELARPATALSVPPSALIFDKAGLRVATVDGDNRIVMKKVTIARDFGRFIEIGSGLDPGDRVIESPPDGAADGDRVRVATAAAKGDAPVAKGDAPVAKGENAAAQGDVGGGKLDAAGEGDERAKK
jgi:RND family efflux transporter MFP subunit